MTEFYDERETRPTEQRKNDLTMGVIAQLTHAKANAPAYKGLDISDVNTLDDLVHLPVTRKSTLIELQKKHPPFGGFAAITRDPLDQIFISPGPIFEPQTKRDDYWRLARALFATGIRRGEIVLNTFSHHMTPAGAMVVDACHAIGAIAIPGGTGQSEQQIEVIQRLQPTAYCGTPSFLKILFDKADEIQADVSCINKALVSGEAFPPPIRQAFSQRGVAALQCYATADLGLIAYESGAESGLILDEDVYLEIVTPGTGNRVGTEEVGEVVVTTLNPDYPLIRFATGDMSAFAEGLSTCGRSNARIKGWLGRADQTAKVRGMFIHPEQIAAVVSKHPEVSKARLVIDWIDQADSMRILCESEVTGSELANAIEISIRELCKVRGQVELVALRSLPNDGIVIEDKRKYE